MSCGLLNIERACGPVTVGISQVQVIDPADVVSLPRRGISGVYETALVISAAATLYTFAADAGTVGFTEDVAQGTQGDYYQQEVVFRARRDRAELVAYAERIRNKQVHLLLTDQHGNQRLLLNMRRRRGRAENGPRGGTNAHSYTWSGSSALPSAFMNISITDAPAVYSVGILQSPDGSYWNILLGLCGELVTTTTTNTETLPATFRLADTDGNPYALSIDNDGVLTTTASSGVISTLRLTSPGAQTYTVSVTDNEVLLTTPDADLPGGGSGQSSGG